MALLDGIKHYCSCSSIQGLKYITEGGRHWTERVFWTVSCLISCWGMGVLLARSYQNSLQAPVSFLAATDWLGWNSTFPAVSVCEFDPDTGVIAQPADRLFGEDHDLDLEAFLREIVFFEGECYSCDNLCGSKINCTTDFQYLVDQVRAPCEEMLSECSWMGSPIDCCSYFRPLDTEIGRCFAINSVQAGSRVPEADRFLVNKMTGPGNIQFTSSKDVYVCIHNGEEVPSLNTPQEEKEKVFRGTRIDKRFAMTEIENDPALHDLPLEKRKCVFPQEGDPPLLTTYPHYSYSACVVECRARAMVDLCNYPWRMCDLEGLSCLLRHSKVLGSLRTADSSKPGLVCTCYPSCTETDYQIKGRTEDSTGNGSYSVVQISMDSLPRTRFQRYIVRTPLDLVVSLGGTAGLFLGVSILSLAEILYFLLLRLLSKPNCKYLIKTNNRKLKLQSKSTKIRNLVKSRRRTVIIPYLP